MKDKAWKEITGRKYFDMQHSELPKSSAFFREVLLRVFLKLKIRIFEKRVPGRHKMAISLTFDRRVNSLLNDS